MLFRADWQCMHFPCDVKSHTVTSCCCSLGQKVHPRDLKDVMSGIGHEYLCALVAESEPWQRSLLPQHDEVADGLANLHTRFCCTGGRHQHKVSRYWPATAASSHPAGEHLSICKTCSTSIDCVALSQRPLLLLIIHDQQVFEVHKVTVTALMNMVCHDHSRYSAVGPLFQHGCSCVRSSKGRSSAMTSQSAWL